MHNSILFLRFWIIFTIIILNSLPNRFPISSYFVWFGGHFSCSFTCWVFLCFFTFFILLCLEWYFCFLAVCSSSLLWKFLVVGGVVCMPCQVFLVREACVGVLVGGAGFLLPGVQWNVQQWVLRCQLVWCDFGQPVYWSSGLCPCVTGKFAWYVLLWNWSALGWCLVSV